MSRLHQAHHRYILDDISTCDALTSENTTFITLLSLMKICRSIRLLWWTCGADELLDSHLLYINFFYYFKILFIYFILHRILDISILLLIDYPFFLLCSE